MVNVLTDKEKQEIGRRIYARRKQLGLTQEQAAELSDLSQNYIAMVESGNSGLGDDSIVGLAKGLQVSADYILFGNPGATDRNRILDIIQPLTGEQLICLEEIIKLYVKACGHADSSDASQKD